MRQQQLRQLVELAYLLTAFNFAPDFVVAEVPWVALQQSNFVQSLRVFEQAIQHEFCRRANVINYNGLKTTLLLRERAADHILHAAVSKSDEGGEAPDFSRSPKGIDNAMVLHPDALTEVLIKLRRLTILSSRWSGTNGADKLNHPALS